VRWDGIRGPLARKNLKTVAVGEKIYGYHSTPEKALVCEARVARAAYPDPADADWLALDVSFAVGCLGRCPWRRCGRRPF
jgi:predicted RNA-binding protein with PUA-like domain